MLSSQGCWENSRKHVSVPSRVLGTEPMLSEGLLPQFWSLLPWLLLLLQVLRSRLPFLSPAVASVISWPRILIPAPPRRHVPLHSLPHFPGPASVSPSARRGLESLRGSPKATCPARSCNPSPDCLTVMWQHFDHIFLASMRASLFLQSDLEEGLSENHLSFPF